MKVMIASLTLALGLSACVKQTIPPAASAQSLLERGRYLSIIGGCNDCHTAGYAVRNGQMDEKDWLQGDRIGWQGPWGTTYPINLRLLVQQTSEADWIKLARASHARPPMPSHVLHTMTDEDLRAFYQFVHSLGAAGEKAPDYLPPGIEAPAPKFNFVMPSGPPDKAPGASGG